MSSARAIAASRVPDRDGAVAAARPIGGDSETSFATVLGNTAIAPQSPPPSPAHYGKPTAARRDSGAEAASPLVTDRNDRGPAPSPAAAQMPEVAPTPATAVAVALSPTTAPSPAEGRESLGSDPDTAAGAPTGPPTPSSARRSRQSEGDLPAAPGRVSHDPTIASGDLICGAAPPGRDAVKEGQGPFYSTQTDSSTASGASAAAGPQALHSPQRRQNRESIAIDAPLLMPTNIPLLAASAGGPALPAVVDSKVEDSAAVPTGEGNHPAPVTNAGVPAGLAHNIAASSQASDDHARCGVSTCRRCTVDRSFGSVTDRSEADRWRACRGAKNYVRRGPRRRFPVGVARWRRCCPE